jgi:urease accessory protein
MRSKLVPLLLLVPVVAHAHTGAGPAHGLTDGLLHPLAGLDHLLAILAVGLWAGQLGGRALWTVPAGFLAAMGAGALAAAAGLTLPAVEPGILTSVLLFGLLAAFAVRLPVSAAAALAAVFALFHGSAHAAEIPAQASGLFYGGGFLASTLVLLAAGVALGATGRHLQVPVMARAAGAVIFAAGLVVVLAA